MSITKSQITGALYIIRQICVVVVVSGSLLLTGCSSYMGWVPDISEISEAPVLLHPSQVRISKEQYQQFAEIQEELRSVILEGADAGKLADIYALMPQNDFRKEGSCYLSSIPFIQWDYEHNSIYQVNLLAFSEDESVLFCIMLEYADGRLDYQYGGYEDQEREILQRYPDEKLVFLKADYYKSCLISQDNHVYPSDEPITIQEGFAEQFDFERMGVSYEEATDRSVCLEVDMSKFGK